MASTGNVLAGAGATLARGAGVDWTNPGNIVSDNATDATCVATGADGSDYLQAKTFGFAIPTDATIRGVFARVEASEHTTGTEPLRAQLQNDAGTLFGAEKTTSIQGSISGTTKAVYTYGSTSDLWSATITPAIVNDVDFGVRFYFSTAHDIRIDYVTLAVEYTRNYTLAGALTATATVAASLLQFAKNYLLAGAVAVATTVGGAMVYNRNASIVGSVAVGTTVAASMVYESGSAQYTITGNVPVTSTVASTMVYNRNAAFTGNTEVYEYGGRDDGVQSSRLPSGKCHGYYYPHRVNPCLQPPCIYYGVGDWGMDGCGGDGLHGSGNCAGARTIGPRP